MSKDDADWYDDEPITSVSQLSWFQRRSLRKQMRREAKADRKNDKRLIKSARKELKRSNKARSKFERKYAKAPTPYDVQAVLDHILRDKAYDSPAQLEAADIVRAGLTAQRNRRYAYFATIGTWLTALAIGFMIATCGACVPTGAARPQTMQESTSVQIIAWCIDDTKFPMIGMSLHGGSGVIVGEHEVLTAQHVVDCKGGLTAVRITLPSGESHPASVRKLLGERADIASLYIDATLYAQPIRYGKRPHDGASVCAATAFPVRTYQCGKVTGYEDPPGDLKITIPVISGNSGSPLYDRTGALVGIVTHRQQCHPAIADDPSSCGGRASTLFKGVRP